MLSPKHIRKTLVGEWAIKGANSAVDCLLELRASLKASGVSKKMVDPGFACCSVALTDW
jgi:hypothetical protein